MVKENAGAAEHVVRFTVFLDNPETVELCHGIRAVRVERSVLVLRDLFYLAVEFAGACLVNAAGLFQVVGTHGLQNAEHTSSVHVGSKFRGIERHLHMALSGQVINFGRLNLAHHLHETHGVAHVGIVQMEIRGSLEVSYTFTVVYRGAADNAVDFVTFRKEEFGEVGAILASNASDKCNVLVCHKNPFCGDPGPSPG